MTPYLLLAAVSGAPALVYQVVWTREVALVVGSQIEAIAWVIAAFFGGLALGARVLGATADRAAHPLLLYARLEAGAAAAALLSIPLLRALGSGTLPPGLDGPRALLAAALVAPTTFLLGGTLPALLRAAHRGALPAARAAGSLVGANTIGAVLGVAMAAAAIPGLGLRRTFQLAAFAGFALAAVAVAVDLVRRGRRAEAAAEPAPLPPARVSPLLLLAAGIAGIATLATEVLAARAAALRLGSSLDAWALVLGLFLAALAVGNALFARRAGQSATPLRDLGFVEAAAALLLAVAIGVLVPSPASPAGGPTRAGLLAITACLLPTTLLMGGAFPFFVRLGAPEGRRLATAFGRISAWNTAGGIAGSLLAPFALLPAFGLRGALLTCAAANAALALVFLARSLPLAGAGLASGALLAGLFLAAQHTPAGHITDPAHLLFARHGRQASAAVVWTPTGRTLYVDGDPEAATAGPPRETEELLAVLPLLLHPAPRRVLEVGLGSGITLATAARFPLEQLDCVEIAGSVMEAARFFAPDNEPVASRADPRLRIVRADGRAFLARQRARYDVVLANTVQPWSLGATGLYSREYYGRVARALRPGGLAVQWLPVNRIGADALAALLRTFYAVFPEGDLYWGAGNLIAVGRIDPAPEVPPAHTLPPKLGELLGRLDVLPPAGLDARRLAGADEVRKAVTGAPLLEDDRPRLERLAVQRRAGGGPGGELVLVEVIAKAGAETNPAAGPLRLFLQSLRARREGDDTRADRLEGLAEAAGLALAGRARAGRLTTTGYAALEDGRLAAAEADLREALAAAPGSREARLGLALLEAGRGHVDGARGRLRALAASDPGWAEAWYRLGLLEQRSGDSEAARRALERALEADPFFPEVLANAGILAARSGDLASARAMLARLRAVSPSGAPRLEQPLADAIAAARRVRE